MNATRTIAAVIACALVCGLARADPPPPVEPEAYDDEPAPCAAACDEDDEPQPPIPARPPPSWPPPSLRAVWPPATLAEAPRPKAHLGGVLVRLSLAAQYRYAIAESFGAADFELQVGSEDPRWSGGGLFGVSAGRSRFGLPFEIVRFGGAALRKLGPRLRLGAGLTAGVMIIQRVTSGESMAAFLGGLLLEADVDLVRAPSGGALFVMARLMLEFLEVDPSSDGFSVGAYAGLGYRF